MQASSPSPPARFISQNLKPESSELADSVFLMSLMLTDFSDNSLVKGLFRIIILLTSFFLKGAQISASRYDVPEIIHTS
jgi:hypothetical protein